MTIDLTISIAAYNVDKLNTELVAALAVKYVSLSTYGQGRDITVRLSDTATQGDQTTATSVCTAHNPAPTTSQAFMTEQNALADYYKAIILSLYQDVDSGLTTIQLLTNAANLVATNATQAAKFNAYRTRLGLGGAISSLTATQQGNLLVLGLEWAAAGLAVARGL